MTSWDSRPHPPRRSGKRQDRGTCYWEALWNLGNGTHADWLFWLFCTVVKNCEKLWKVKVVNYMLLVGLLLAISSLLWYEFPNNAKTCMLLMPPQEAGKEALPGSCTNSQPYTWDHMGTVCECEFVIPWPGCGVLGVKATARDLQQHDTNIRGTNTVRNLGKISE